MRQSLFCTALDVHASHAVSMHAGDSEEAEEAAARLLVFGRKVIAAAAMTQPPDPGAAAGWDEVSSPSQIQIQYCIFQAFTWRLLTQTRSPAASTLCLKQTRLQDIRSPLVVATLDSLASAADPQALKQEMRALFPHLAQLICSRQLPLRSAVAGLFSQHLTGLLQL